MDVFQKVTKNYEILLSIFKKINLQDQLQAIEVCKEFEYVIEKFIWKLKFKEIQILQNNEYGIQFTDAADNWYNLTQSESQTFFRVLAKHVEKLIIYHFYKDKLTDCYKFENLKFLEFYRATVTKNNLEYLASNCTKLEIIHFIYCENVNNSIFDLNKRGQLDTLAKLERLQELKLVAGVHFDFTLFNEIFNKLCLKSLILNVHIYGDEVEEEKLKNCKALESLFLDCFYEIEAWQKLEGIYLKKFENLNALTINSDNGFFRDNNMATLAATCNNLQELTLIQWIVLIEKFPPQLKLKKLILKYCSNLSWKNLQQILSELNLEEFVSENNEYEGETDFSSNESNIANTLQILDIETKQNQEFLELFKNIDKTAENLKIFRYKFTRNSPYKLLQNFLKKCTNLEELCITNVAIPIEDIMNLKFLKMLKFSIFPQITWEFLQTMLTNRSLENISLEMSKQMERKIIKYAKTPDNDYDDNDDDLSDFDLLILKQNVKKISLNFPYDHTNLKFLKIPFIIFYKHQDFFINFLNLNKTLKLTLYCYHNPEEMLNQTFLNKLLNNTKFPSHIRYIKILNKYYDCNDLKENFSTTVDDVSDNNGCLILTL